MKHPRQRRNVNQQFAKFFSPSTACLRATVNANTKFMNRTQAAWVGNSDLTN